MDGIVRLQIEAADKFNGERDHALVQPNLSSPELS